MSDVMRPIPFAQVMDWVLTEHDTQASIFGVRKAYVDLCREDRDPLWPGRRPQHPARAEHHRLLRGGLALL